MSSQPSENNEQSRFPSLASLKAVNNLMLKRRRQEENAVHFLTEVEAFIRKGRATGAVLNADAERWTGQSLLDYWANFLYRSAIQIPASDINLAPFNPALVPDIDETKQPYLGLDPFRESTQGLFFGREKLVDDLSDKLKQKRFLAVLGPSGCGKSSLVLAGLLPALKNGKVEGSGKWQYLPSIVPGFDPLASLVSLVHRPGSAPASTTQLEVEKLKKDSGHLLQLINQARFEPSLIIVDQFEEIFTLTTDETIRRAFVANLVSLVEYPDLRHSVVLTMRSDFEPYVANIPELQSYFLSATVRVTALSPAELHEVIQKPADLIGLKFEEGIVDQLVIEALAEPVALPLLQFTLLKLWKARQHNLVTWEAFHQLGSCREALTRSADRFYTSLSPIDQSRVKWVLLRLVRPGAGVEVFSNRVARDTLYRAVEDREHTDHVLDGLIEAGLVRETAGAVASEVKVEVAHEALVRQWSRLVGWLEEERINLRKRLVLTEAARHWDASGQDASALLRGSLLDEALRYDDLNQQEEAYVKQSQRQKLRHRRYSIVAVSGTIFALLLLAVFSLFQATAARTSERKAFSRQLAAEAVDSNNSLDLGLLLSLEANQVEPTAEARNSLLALLVQNPGLVTYLHGPKRSALAMCFPGNSTLITVNGDGTINTWDPNSPRKTPIVSFLHRRLQAAHISPDAKVVALLSSGDDIVVLDTATGQQRQKFQLPDVSGLAFSPDGKILAAFVGPFSGSAEAVTLWDVFSGKPLSKIVLKDQGFESISNIAFSPDSKILATGSDEGNLILWDVDTGRMVHTLKKNANESARLKMNRWFWDASISALSFNPSNGKILASSDGKTITLWDLTKYSVLSEISDDRAKGASTLVFNREGTRLASDGLEGSISIWDVEKSSAATKATAITIKGPSNDDLFMAFSEDGKTLASTSPTGDVILWDLSLKRRLQTEVSSESKGGFSSVAFSSDGTMAAGTEEGEIVLFDAATRQPKAHLIQPRDTTSNNDDNTPQSGPRQRSERRVFDLSFSSNGKVLLSHYSSGRAILWDLNTNKEIVELPRLDPTKLITGVSLTPDARTVAWIYRSRHSGSKQAKEVPESSLLLWKYASDKSPQVLIDKGADQVSSVAFSPDGEVLAVGMKDLTVLLLSTNTHEQLARLTDPQTQKNINESSDILVTRSLAFSPDGKTLAAGNSDNSVYLWDVAKRSLRDEPLTKHSHSVIRLAFSSDSRILASGSYDGTIVLWDIETHQLLGTIPIARPFNLPDPAFSPDRKFLAVALSGSEAPTISLWDISMDSWREQACLVANRNLTQSEWRQYIGKERPYHLTCPKAPIETVSR